MMRDRIGFKLLERTGPMFGVAVLVEEAALREYALALLQYFSTSPSGTKCKIAVKEDHWQRCRCTSLGLPTALARSASSLARVCAPTHTRARPALVPACALRSSWRERAHCAGCPADVVSRLWLVY